MTLAFDPTNTAFPPRRVSGEIATILAQPLVITCVGEVEYTEDDPALGTWWQQQTVTLGRCASIAEAITFVTLAVASGDFQLDDDEALGISPRLFVILDRDKHLVLAGEVWGSEIRWCDPVSNNTEARQVVEGASRIRADASYEAGWDNHSTAKGLRHKASVLEGRLVDAAWRDEVRRSLKELV